MDIAVVAQSKQSVPERTQRPRYKQKHVPNISKRHKQKKSTPVLPKVSRASAAKAEKYICVILDGIGSWIRFREND